MAVQLGPLALTAAGGALLVGACLGAGAALWWVAR
jgi:hypothetical protein